MPIVEKAFMETFEGSCPHSERNCECAKLGIYYDPHLRIHIQTKDAKPLEFDARPYSNGLDWVIYHPVTDSKPEYWTIDETQLCDQLPANILQMAEEAAKNELTKYFVPFLTTGIAARVDGLYKLMKRTRGVTSNGAPSLKTYAASDLPTMDIKPIQFAIEKILPVGLVLFAAPSKTGKSWACIDICNAVATGTSWMGLQALQGDTLYLDLESSQGRLRERFRKMNLSPPAGMEVCHTARPIDAGLLDQLAEWCNKKPNPRLIIIDTLVKVQGSSKRGENAYERDSRLLSPMQQFAMNRNIAVVLVTHKRKQSNYIPDDPFEGIMGSQGQMGIADTVWMITGKRTDEEKHLLATGRDIEQMDLTIKQNPDTMRWYLVGDTEELIAARERQNFDNSPVVKTIRKYCTPTWACTAQELIDTVADETGEYPATDPRSMGVLLRSITPSLATNAGITVIFPKQSDKPKRYKFRQHDFTGKA